MDWSETEWRPERAYAFPGAMWRALRTTNSLENLNREFRRRTKTQASFEVTLVEETIDRGFIKATPERLIGDRAYDSDGLDERLAQERGIELIAHTGATASARRLRTAVLFVA